MADEFAADVGVDSAPTAALLDGLALGAALRARDEDEMHQYEVGILQDIHKELQRENARLKRAVANLTLDKLILEEAAKGNF